MNIRGLLKVLVKEKYEIPSHAPFYSFHMPAEVLISQKYVPDIQASYPLCYFLQLSFLQNPHINKEKISVEKIKAN